MCGINNMCLIMRCLKVLKVPFLETPCISRVICEYFSLLVQNLLKQIQNKRFFCFKVHSSYHPRIYSACLVFQTQPAEQPALSWQRQSTPVPPLQMHLNNSTFSILALLI